MVQAEYDESGQMILPPVDSSAEQGSSTTLETAKDSAEQDDGATFGQIEQCSIVSLSAPDPSFLASDSQDSQDSQLSMGTIEFEPDKDNLILSVESISMAQFCMFDTDNTENTEADADKNALKMDSATDEALTVDVDTSAVDIEYLSPMPCDETLTDQHNNMGDSVEHVEQENEQKTDVTNEKEGTESAADNIAQGKEEKKDKGKLGFVPYSDSEDENEEEKTAASPKSAIEKKGISDNATESDTAVKNGLTSKTGCSTEDGLTSNSNGIAMGSAVESHETLKDTSFDSGQTSDHETVDLSGLDPHCSRTLPIRNLTSQKAKMFSGASSDLNSSLGQSIPKTSRMITIGTQTTLELDWAHIDKSTGLAPVLTGSSTSSYSSSGFQTASSNDSLSSASRHGLASSKGGSPARSSPSRPKSGLAASSKSGSVTDHVSPVAKKSTTKQPISQVAKKSTGARPPTNHGPVAQVGQVAKKSTAKPSATISQVAKKSTAKPHSPRKRNRNPSSDTDSSEDSDSSSKSESPDKPSIAQRKGIKGGTQITASVTKRKTSRQGSREASVKKATSIMKKKTRSQSASGGSDGDQSAKANLKREVKKNKRRAARAAARAITVQSMESEVTAHPKRHSLGRKTSESMGSPGGSSSHGADSEAEKLKKALETDSGLVIGAGGKIVKRKIVPIKPLQLHATRSHSIQDSSKPSTSKSHQEGQGGAKGKGEGETSGNEPTSPRRKDKGPHHDGKGGSGTSHWDSAWKQ